MRRHPLSRPLCVTLVTYSVTIRFAVALQNVIMNRGKKYPIRAEFAQPGASVTATGP